MDYSELTNKQLRKRIKLLRKLHDLETTSTCKSDGSKSDGSKSGLWVPDKRNWHEYDPSNGLIGYELRSTITDVLYHKEREHQMFDASSDDVNYGEKCWDVNFTWKNDERYGVDPNTNIVAYTYDT